MVSQIQTIKNLYDQDYYLWLKTTINQLKIGHLSEIDLDNLIEELESMGRSQKRTVKSLLTLIFEHLLKLKYWESERDRNEGHWRREIITFRQGLNDEIQDSPSLKPYILEIFNDCYLQARKRTSAISKLSPDTFPLVPLASLAEILDEDWFPNY